MRRPQRTLNRLTKLKVDSLLQRPGKPVCDGGGLWLVVSTAGAASWVFRYQLRGVARSMGLGSARQLSLAEAREKATEARKLLESDGDPLEDRAVHESTVALAAVPAMTFKQCAQAYIESHSAGWKNEKHAAQWPASLESYAYPSIGALDIRAITTGHVCAILEPIWTKRTETANRVRGRIEAVIDWATARGYRTGDNPARWRGHLDNLFPPRSKVARVEHHPALPYAEIGDFLIGLRKLDGSGSRLLELTILTAARSGEAIGMSWDEIDLSAASWIVPAARMKAGAAHRVPLSPAAMALLSAIPEAARHGLVFPGARAGRPLSGAVMLATLRRMGRSDLTVHGFRSCFRNWCAEQTNYPREVAESALAHTNRDKVESAYLRSDHFEKRKRLMADWSNYCAAPSAGASVIPIRKTADQ